ncbi:MAG: decaprenyl-phosphate phosphoribosyltransferase [Deltaproteobacteria bacterium]|nr:decaprenyl-phosphate phosphoribosyltransferase [Deltaproteobacteria bacterium]
MNSNANRVFLLVKSARPLQWMKNIVVLAPLVFAHKLMDRDLFTKAVIAFLVFCLVASATYLLNDLKDREKDRLHPVKKNRPIAAGLLGPWSVFPAAIALTLTGLATSYYFLGLDFSTWIVVYILVQTAYSFGLKGVIIIDVFTVSAGYVVRVVGGAVAIHVPASAWLILCTLLLSLFLSLAKRRHEILLLGDMAEDHRKSLVQYDRSLLDQMVGVVAPATVIAYALYTLDPDTVKRFGGQGLFYTVPMVLYGLFRYMYLVHAKRKGGEPDKTLLTDTALLLDVLLYAILVIALIYLR